MAASNTSWTGRDWAAALSGPVALMGAFIAAWFGRRSASATAWQRANEVELTNIQERLDRFYGPFIQMLKTDHLLAQELRARMKMVDWEVSS